MSRLSEPDVKSHHVSPFNINVSGLMKQKKITLEDKNKLKEANKWKI
jgi:hypothetical protein